MLPETQEYYNIATWLKDKVNYHKKSKYKTSRYRQVLHGQIWYCDLGYNIGTEKNKMRPIIPANMTSYSFLDKDSMVQCEEIRAVSKSRLDIARGCIGTLISTDFEMIKGKFRRTYNL